MEARYSHSLVTGQDKQTTFVCVSVCGVIGTLTNSPTRLPFKLESLFINKLPDKIGMNWLRRG